MSINQKTLQFLKELYSTNPSADSIELEFMQIAELVPFLPLLGRFSNLKRLSLHGNRIKQLPVDMSQFRTLQQLDISNNMLSNCDMMIMSLRTLPTLKRLVCPFKKEDEEKIKRGLLTLEFLNNSKIIREKPKPKEQPKKANSHQLKNEDIEAASQLYDEIRELFRTSYEQLDETDMMRQFNDEIETQIGDMKASLQQDSKTTETMRSIIFLTTKYSLYKMAQAKIVNLLYDVDQKYGTVVDTLFQVLNRVMKDLTEVAMESEKKMVYTNPQFAASKTMPDEQLNVTKETARFQKFEKEIKRLRKQRDELQSDILALEAENKKYLDTLVRHSKGDRSLLYSVNSKRVEGSSPRKNQTVGSETGKQGIPPQKAPREFVAVPTSKAITLKQLKDTIEEIYQSKVKFDQKTYESRLPRETMYQYLFTFLNQKYGLKNLTIDWASSIVGGIQNYSNEDNDVAVFGKILRNQCDEEFRYTQAEVKTAILELLKMHVRTRHPLKTASQLNEIVQEKMANYISAEECEDIVKYMYNVEDASDLIDKLKMIYALQPHKNESAGRRQLTREQQNQLQFQHQRKRIRYQSFVKCVLDYQLRSHQKYLKPLVQAFRRVDKDADGIINEIEFSELLQGLSEDADDLAPRFLNIVDPYSTNTITFTQMCKLLSNFPEGQSVLARHLKQHQQT